VPAIDVRDLTVRYGAVTAVDRVSFTAEAGRVLVVLGPNGAGKTSTVETLEGYRRAAAGSATVLNLDPQRDHRALTRRMGVMLQQGGVYPGIKPLEVLRLFAAYYDDPQRPEELLDRVGLADVLNTPWRHLSGGEQQRLSLALALVGRPAVVFLDEPTAGIDPGGRRVVRDIVAELRGAGVCVVVTTHELDEAERLADDVVILDRGRVVATGTPAELMAGTVEEVRFAAPAGIDVAALAAHVGAPVTEVTGGEYIVEIAPAPAVVAAITAWLADQDLPLADLRAGRQRFEDVFLRLTSPPAEADGSGGGS
jgi:ABC-2 type transport system ATP-binding protein